MRTIDIRFLRQGLIKVNQPENWNEMTLKEKETYCWKVLNNASDRELVFAMSDFQGEDLNSMFDETPNIEAIESVDMESMNNPIYTEASTQAWDSFSESSGVLR